MAEDEMVGWHHRLMGHEFEQTGRQRETWKPGMLQSMGQQRVGHYLASEQQQSVRDHDTFIWWVDRKFTF